MLVVLVVRDGAAWLRQCLIALSRQTHPRLGVVAVDNGSSDASPEMLETTLGSDRVIRLGRNRGFGGAAAEALKSTAAERADYLLLLHDDTVLAPDAVERLVDIAERVDGAGIVGAKIRDADHPDVLLDVGQTIDRFGYPYSPLEPGEIDQGQYDRLREVMAVSSSAMLIRGGIAGTIGLPDDRFPTRFADVDFCWRARVAGYRVLMAPRAVALHRSAGGRGQRAVAERSHGARYERERAGLGAVLKNYRLLTLLWTLPLWLGQAAARSVSLLVSRRFEDAFQMAAAVWWNVRHLLGTLRIRRRAQRARRTRDHEVRAFMAPAGELARRWAITVAEWARPPDAEAIEGEQVAPVSGWRLLGQFAAAHPLLVAWVAAAVLAALSYRHLAGVHPLVGGAIADAPSSASGYFNELVSGIRTTGLGGTQAASPALGLLGLGSVAALGSTELLQKAMLFVLPAAAAVGAARATRRFTGQRLPAVVAGAVYALAPVTMWAFSEGLIPELVFLAGLPWLVTRLQIGFAVRPGRERLRWAIGVGAGLAVLVSFFPGTLLAAAVVLLASMLSPGTGTRRGGLWGAAIALVFAAILVFPFAWVLVDGAANSLAVPVGARTFAEVARLSPGDAPGGWLPSFYLPVLAALGLAFVSRTLFRPAVRAGLTAILCVYLAWASGAGWLPEAVSNVPAYLGLAAFSLSLMVGLALSSAVRGVERASFGHRQVGAAVLSLLAAAGLALQASQAALGAWAVGGPTKVPAAFALVQAYPGPPERVVWIGRSDGGPMIAPGGMPEGTAGAGAAAVRFAVGFTDGATALDTGRPPAGPGYDALSQALGEALSGDTRHGGALLAPFAVQFLVAAPGDLPARTLQRLNEQVDLVRVEAGGLVIYRNVESVPVAARTDPSWSAAASSGSPLAVSALRSTGSSALSGSGQRYEAAVTTASFVLLSQQFDARWRMTVGNGPAVAPARAFGWGMGFDTSGGDVVVRYTAQWIRTLEMLLLAVLWGLALWITRRPARDG